jgi:cell division protein DivIC
MVTPGKTKVTTLNNRTVEQYDRDMKVKNKRKKGLFRRLTVFAFLVSIGSYLVISTLTSQASVIENKNEEKKVLEQKLVEVQSEKQKLKLEVQKLHDIDYIGEIARKDYSFSRPGEIIFKLPTNE